MNQINKYKFFCIYHTVIKDRLLSIFYDRWLIESGEPWKNNAAFGSVIRKKLPLVYNKFDKNLQKYIDDGQIYNLNYSSLFEILINSNSNLKKLNENHTNEIIDQNQIIQTLDDHFHNFILTLFEKRNIESFNNYDIIIELIKKLDKSTGRVAAALENGIVSIENEINNKFKDDYNSCMVVDLVNENKAIEMNKKGIIKLKEKKKKILPLELEYFVCALDLENISSFITGELILNLGYRVFEIALATTTSFTSNIICDGEGLLVNSKQNISASIKFRPCRALGYFKLGIVQSKLGEYEEALELFQSSLILDQNLSNDVDEWINKINDKINFKTQSIEINGVRNYEKEAKLIIEKYSCLNQFNHNNRNNKNRVESFISTIHNKVHINALNMLSRYSGASQKFIYEKAILDHAANLIDIDMDKILECYNICISNRTEWANAYYLLAMLKIEEKPPSESNDRLIVSLLLKASLLPLVFSQPKKTGRSGKFVKDLYDYENMNYINNYFVNYANVRLGTIYRFGSYGEDVDLEKAQHYFELAVKNFKIVKDKSMQLDKNCFYLLGHMFYHGQYKDVVPNLEKAKQLWRKGSEIGDEKCKDSLKKYFNEQSTTSISTEIQVVDDHITDENNQVELIKGSNFKKIDYKLMNSTIDFSIIKEIALNKEHPSNEYANYVYSTHLKILKFIRLFKELESKKNGNGGKLKDKFEVIKILASAFRDYENYSFIRIPSTIINDAKELVNQLLESSPSNIDVRICRLGLNRIANYEIDNRFYLKILEFIQESIGLCKNEKDYLIFKYYQIIYQIYTSSEINILFNNLIQVLMDNNNKNNTSDKDVFIYLLLSIFKYIKTTSPLFQSIKDQYLDLIISSVDSYNSRSIKGNPQNAEINYNLFLLLPNLNNGIENLNCTRLSMNYLKIAQSAHKCLIPAFTNHLYIKFDEIFNQVDLILEKNILHNNNK